MAPELLDPPTQDSPQPDDTVADATSGRKRSSIARGWPRTVVTLREWRRNPVRVVLPWLLLSIVIASTLILLTWWVSLHSAPLERELKVLPNHAPKHPWEEMARLLRNNLTVLALHGAACLAGFIIYMSIHEPDENEGARLRRVTQLVAFVGIPFIPIATLLSISTQAWFLGGYASTISYQVGVEPLPLMTSTLPHALLELTAVFLPLAAFIVVGRRTSRRPQLLAATIVSVTLAIPMLLLASYIETDSWHTRLQRAAKDWPMFDDRDVAYFEVPAEGNAVDQVRLALHGPAIDERFSSKEKALSAIERHAKPDKALALLEVPHGYVVYEAWTGCADPFRPCGTFQSRSGTTRPLSLERFERAHVAIGSKGGALASEHLVSLHQDGCERTVFDFMPDTKRPHRCDF